MSGYSFLGFARLTVAADSGWITRQQVDLIREEEIWTPTEKPPPLDSGGMLWVLQDYRQNYLSREIEAFASALEGRVRAGGLNLDQARTAQEAYSTLIASERARVDRMIEGVEGTYERREQLAEVRSQLTSAIEAGEITEAQARARWEEFAERVGGGR